MHSTKDLAWIMRRIILLLGIIAIAAIPTTSFAQSQEPVVIYLFWGDGCPHCEVARPALRALAQHYGVELREYEVWYNAENQAAFISMAAAAGFEPRYVPTIFVADQHWDGYSEEIEAEIEAVITACLKTTCPDPAVGITLPANNSSQDPSAGEVNLPTAGGQMQSDGFALAVIVMLGMVAALVYAFVYLQSGLRKRRSQRPAAAPGKWQHVGMLVLSLVGLGVAGYLAYVETQAVPAVCGPVGDCNAVQSSSYARLFGLLPIGVLGVFGYLMILAAWGYQRLRHDRLADWAALAVFSMALFGVLFSLYLTYLEPFVIKAVCMWCVTSAVIITLLLLLSLKPALQSIQRFRR